jgi:hypothetical protein
MEDSFRREWRNPVRLGIDIFRAVDAKRLQILREEFGVGRSSERPDQQ